ncbi:hypothetical protein PCYB_147770, partial [Plasmodium cynomolgi strain B]
MRDNLSLKHGSLMKKDSNYKKDVLQKDDLVKENDLLKQKFLKKDDFIRTSSLKKKTLFPPIYDDFVDDTPAIDRREILQKNDLIKKIDIKDIKKPAPKSDSLEKIDVEIITPKDKLPKSDSSGKIDVEIITPKDKLPKSDSLEKIDVEIITPKDKLPKIDSLEKIDVETTPKDKLPKSDLADKIDKTKIEQITKKKQWTIEIHMSEKKGKDEITTKKKNKTTTISTHMCEKTKKSELIDILDSKSKDDKIGEEKVAKRKKFIVDIHMEKKEKKKPLIKKKWLIEVIMKNVFPKKEFEILRELYDSHIIDVDVIDLLNQAKDEILFENILANTREKPRRFQFLRNWRFYGITAIVAIGTIIGCAIGYINVMDIDVVLDSAV